jgi:hypothetical protein
MVVYLDRGKLLRANGATILLGGGLAVLALDPWRHGIVATRMLAIISVDDEGISYDIPRTGPFAFGGSLGWGEIKALYVGEITLSRRGQAGVQRLLCVLPRDEEAFLRRYSVMTMAVLALMKMGVGSPFVIPEAMLPLTIDELYERVRTQFAEMIEANGIELREEYKGSLGASKKMNGETTG